ncbi:hypothetical protein VTK73DRAFT_1426 [Phialemonium thermophilum]|uniref:Uncharacterized protein n=1 Tax=Phialemonium thermophilum TaxID=223376 RepID=A0ABR3VTF3_9PEZI
MRRSRDPCWPSAARASAARWRCRTSSSRARGPPRACWRYNGTCAQRRRGKQPCGVSSLSPRFLYLLYLLYLLPAADPPLLSHADCHVRLGGATGTDLTSQQCPPSTTSTDSSACNAGSLMMHITPNASAYLENVWLWVADHDLDDPDWNSDVNAMVDPNSVLTKHHLKIYIYTDIHIYIHANAYAHIHIYMHIHTHTHTYTHTHIHTYTHTHTHIHT